MKRYNPSPSNSFRYFLPGSGRACRTFISVRAIGVSVLSSPISGVHLRHGNLFPVRLLALETRRRRTIADADYAVKTGLFRHFEWRISTSRVASVVSLERRVWDSNPRGTFIPAGFQDRCLQPLGHPSYAYKISSFHLTQNPALSEGARCETG